MAKTSRIESRVTVGMDLGDKYSCYCVLDESGEVVEEGRVATTARGVSRRFRELAPARVAIEVGTHSPWVQRLLTECGHEVVVANARKVSLISRSDTKDDRGDAEWLARLARADVKLLSPIRHRGSQAQQDRAVLRSRAALVQSRTQLVNHVRGMVKSFGGRLRSCSAQSFHKQVTGQIPEELAPAVTPILEIIGSLTRQIRRYDKHIETLTVHRYPETGLLQQVTGVGPQTALSYVLTIEDPHRFRCSRAVGAYLGLRPRRRQSGNNDPELRITKAGDPAVRRLLVGAAHYILGPFGPDCDLRRWGLALAARGKKNAKKQAVVAVARKLAVVLHRLWITGEEYEPLRNTEARSRHPRPQARTA